MRKGTVASIFFRKNRHLIQLLVERQGHLPTLDEALQYVLMIEDNPSVQSGKVQKSREKVIESAPKKVVQRKASKNIQKHTKGKKIRGSVINLDTIFWPEEIEKEKFDETINVLREEKVTKIEEELLTELKKTSEIAEERVKQEKYLFNEQELALAHEFLEKEESVVKSIEFLGSTSIKRRAREKPPIKILRTIEQYSIEDNPEAFRRFFLSRYEKLRGILLKRMPKSFEDNNMDLVVLVRDVIDQGNYGLIIGEYLTETDEIADGLFVVSFAYDNGTLKEKFDHIIPDIVIGLKVRKTSQGKFIVNDIIFPEVPRLGKRGRAKEDTYVLFLSDIHLGSKKFLEKMFLRFLDFTNGAVNNKVLREYAEKLDYILILGDVVDGVGVYPDQKNELEIPNIYDQYQKIAEYLEQIPGDIDIIIIPGNHDAAGNFIPQPPIPIEIAEPLYNLKNVKVISNPAMIEIENVKILLYHGYGIEKVASMLHMGIDKPTRIISELLRYRHLVPTWGSIPLAPLPEDHLVIADVPDIVAMGHVHIFDARVAKGNIITIVPGSFQDITSWQIKLGISPTPGVFGLVNLRTFELKVLKFTEKDVILL